MAIYRTTPGAGSASITEADYGNQIPLNFMDVNYEVAIFLLIALGVAAAIGTFGNVLTLVAVATHRSLRSVEAVFVVNLAFCDLYITLLAEPLSIVAKTVGWKYFEGIPGLCRAIGYFCTLSCVGSLMSLTIMSLNRYVLICHHTLYPKIFTFKKCLFYCFFIYLFGFFLIAFNFFGIGDHSFDYKSYECVWDRMATHDYTIFFSIVLVWVPISVTAVAYGRTYWYVYKVRMTVCKTLGSKAPAKGAKDCEASSMFSQTEKTQDTEIDVPDVQFTKSAGEPKDSGIALEADIPHDASTAEVTGSVDQKLEPLKAQDKDANGAAMADNNSNNKLGVPMTKGSNNGLTAAAGVNSPETAQVSTDVNSAAASKANSGMKLARPLFIIYVVFSTCWIPYSLIAISDRQDSFPHELHAFVMVFAHMNSSVNWLVYYHTHNKMRRAFQDLLGFSKSRLASVQPKNTARTVTS